MSTQKLDEEWERKTFGQAYAQAYGQAYAQAYAQIYEQGFQEGLLEESKRLVSFLYEARFGATPRVLADAVKAMHDMATLDRWLLLVGTRSQEEVDAAVQA